MSNEDETVFVVFNGEICNHASLRNELENKGRRFRSRGDTEVIVHLYEEYGDACLEMLKGMFGLAIFDARLRRLLLGRDRSGMKPLYYAQTPRRVCLAVSCIPPGKVHTSAAVISRFSFTEVYTP